MGKVHIDVEPIIAAIREKVTHIHGDRLSLGDIKVLRGKDGTKKEGHILIMIETSHKMRLDVDIDCNEMMRNKHYLDTLIPDIYAFFDSAMEARQECLRMGY